MILDNPPNQIAGRGALLSGEHLDLPEDRLRKLPCSPHHDRCPMSDTLVELPTTNSSVCPDEVRRMYRDPSGQTRKTGSTTRIEGLTRYVGTEVKQSVGNQSEAEEGLPVAAGGASSREASLTLSEESAMCPLLDWCFKKPRKILLKPPGQIPVGDGLARRNARSTLERRRDTSSHQDSKEDAPCDEAEVLAADLFVLAWDNPQASRFGVAADDHYHREDLVWESGLTSQELPNYLLMRSEVETCGVSAVEKPLFMNGPPPDDAEGEICELGSIDAYVVGGKSRKVGEPLSW
jgi:hypothetical protein